MSHAAATPDDDLAELVIEAGTKIAPSAPKRSGVQSPAPEESRAAENPVPPWVTAILTNLESLSDAQNENALRLSRLEKALAVNDQVFQVLGETRQALDQRNLINRVMSSSSKAFGFF